MNKPILPPIVRDLASAQRQQRLFWQVALAQGPAIEAVVFDAYGTLFSVAALEAHCQDIVPDPTAFVAFWRAKQLEGSWQRALSGYYADFAQVTHEALLTTLAQFRVQPKPATVRALVACWSKLTAFPDAATTLERLHDLPLAILSNATPAMLQAVVATNDFPRTFQAILSVDAVQTYKPDPRVYALAPAALDLPAERILFVSANSWDALGAKAFGLRVAWCNREQQPIDHYGPAPDLVVHALTDIAAALQR